MRVKGGSLTKAGRAALNYERVSDGLRGMAPSCQAKYVRSKAKADEGFARG